MTCGNCIRKVKSEILKLGNVMNADIQLPAPQARISMQQHIPIADLQKSLSKAGNFTIREAGHVHHSHVNEEKRRSFFATYKPVLVIGAYILSITLLIETFNQPADFHRWMRHFMAGFFLSFSFFKLLDLKGFADSYSTYDIVAKRWKGWAYFYAFAELVLGLAFLINFNPLLTNVMTIAIMTISLVGVVQSVLNRQTIRCACLGTVFNLPMSTVTIIENALMIIMSGLMIASML
jgi:copper chaperone CopZ